MAWIASNTPLDQSQMENNALLLASYFSAKGWSLNAICGMLGNMQSESTINPGRWESGVVAPESGYGLVQWTPSTNVTDWLTVNNYPIDSGEGQCARIQYELDNGLQWIPTPMYPQSFKEFSTSLLKPYDLAMMFIRNYERPFDPNQPARGLQAEAWFTFLSESYFTPRLTKEGMQGARYWYSSTNPFYPAYGLPNCTCYAWGRFWEIGDWNKTGENVPTLPTGNGGEWWGSVTGYETGQIPQLGCVACYKSKSGGAGHVAIVEKLDGDTITMSNSNYYRGTEGTPEWERNYFFLSTATKQNNWEWDSDLTFQGFIYNPYARQPVPPPTPVVKKKLPYWFYLRPNYKKGMN